MHIVEKCKPYIVANQRNDKNCDKLRILQNSTNSTKIMKYGHHSVKLVNIAKNCKQQ